MEEIEKLIPEIAWIENRELREKVKEVWVLALERGGWNSLEEVPFTLSFENSGKLVEHVRRVTRMVKRLAELREEKINMDYLLAGAILHDVGKLLEYKKEGEKIVVNEKVERHPISGSKLAESCGLPKEVVHIVATHSHEGDKMKRSKESIIVHHCDFIDFELRREESERD
ncbi:MAG: HD domain-containing protein [Thermoplasmata archaeon]|nr:HD domain-containing protein [Thermoplasmata archaeon]